MLANMYLQGRLKLEELVAARIELDQVNEGYEVMRRGTEARSVIVY
jgi:S-(hydroxymethyl)glutathione dehydrogenase/alcohol dehydrogenase